jgi:preprotein translocase subunit SecG
MDLLAIAQIILSVLLIGAILIQQSDAGLGSAFGGGDGSGTHTRRGMEKTLFYATILVAVLFVLSTCLALIF